MALLQIITQIKRQHLHRQKFATLSPRYVSGDTKYEIFKQTKILYFR